MRQPFVASPEFGGRVAAVIVQGCLPQARRALPYCSPAGLRVPQMAAVGTHGVSAVRADVIALSPEMDETSRAMPVPEPIHKSSRGGHMPTISLLRGVAISFAALMISTGANAQLFRAYLAPTGSDANPCTLPAPCRLLPAALAAVADGGEIWMLDSGNYNTTAVSITKSVSILATPGALGSVVANGFDAITINAPSSKVKLSNLTLRPLPGAGGNGISVTAVGSLMIDSVALENLAIGLHLTGAAVIKIKDSLFRSNGYAIYLEQTGGAQEVVAIDNTSFVDNPQSIIATTNSTTGFIRLTVDNSTVTGTTGGGNGAIALGGGVASAAPVTAIFVRTKIAGYGPAGNGTGLSSYGAQTVVTMSDCHISGWYYGARPLNGVSGLGVLRSLGNNVFVDNLSNGSFSPVAPL